MTTLIILILLILAAFLLGWLISRLIFKGGSSSTNGGHTLALISEREAELAACKSHNAAINSKIAAAKSFVAEAPTINIAPEIVVSAPITNPIPVVNTLKETPMVESNRVDDLKIVEGIGPKIEELLNNAGIKTFAQLESTSVARLNEILEKAGPRYQMHDPGTWPQQSGLANNGKWTELKILQDELNKGKVE